MTINIYVNTWGRYNDGLVGSGFISLGKMDNEELAALLKERLKDNDPEYFIQDYEGDVGLEESTDFWMINEALYNLDDCNNEMFLAITEFESLTEAIEAIENDFDDYRLHYDVNSNTDLGYELIEEGGQEIPEWMQYYFDYEKFGRDYTLNACGTFTSFGFIERL